MSKKRNQVLFNKPDDPKFLKLFKQQAGYRDDDGTDIDAKRAKLDSANRSDNSDCSDNEEEQPQVVVTRTGDLTADEALLEKERIELENNTKPADLSERIVFKAKHKSQTEVASSSGGDQLKSEDAKKKSVEKSSSKKSHKSSQSKLSFALEDDDDNAE